MACLICLSHYSFAFWLKTRHDVMANSCYITYIHMYAYVCVFIYICALCWLGFKCASKVCNLSQTSAWRTHFRWQKLKTCWNSRRFHESLLINDTLQISAVHRYSIYVYMYVYFRVILNSFCQYLRLLLIPPQLLQWPNLLLFSGSGLTIC